MSNIKILKEQVKDLKVLFVDDEDDVRDGTASLLKKIFTTVVICSNGKEGLDTFENGNFDVVLTDVLMPIMDGIEMATKIKEINPDIFIIFLTASRSMTDIDKGLSNITLEKPLLFEDIVSLLEELKKLNPKKTL